MAAQGFGQLRNLVAGRGVRLVGLCAAAVAVALAAMACGAGGVTADRDQSADSSVRLVTVAGGVALVSDRHGPARVAGGLASGFAHDELGAVTAASNLAARVSLAAGAEVFESTIARQCYGDTALMLERIRRERPRFDGEPDGGGAGRVAAVGYRLIGGDPAGERVVVSLVADTEQSRQLGGATRLDVTLRWADGDWRLQVPLPRPLLASTTASYTMVGTR